MCRPIEGQNMPTGLALEFDTALLSPTLTASEAGARVDGFTNVFWEQLTQTTIGDSFFDVAEVVEPTAEQTSAAFWSEPAQS